MSLHNYTKPIVGATVITLLLCVVGYSVFAGGPKYGPESTGESFQTFEQVYGQSQPAQRQAAVTRMQADELSVPDAVESEDNTNAADGERKKPQRRQRQRRIRQQLNDDRGEHTEGSDDGQVVPRRRGPFMPANNP